MNKTNTKLTSVNVDKENHKKFKVLCIQNNITFQKLVNIAVEMYINDDSFRELITKR
tara:strand:- start:846 stop:1016 length:171 start_codon:yes stop_codon:yes gene_type:complete